MDYAYHLLYCDKYVTGADTLADALVIRWKHFMATGHWLDVKEVCYITK